MTQQLPQPGDVWGVPDQPETWHRVRRVHNASDGTIVSYDTFSVRSWTNMRGWNKWLTTTGAVRIWPPMESKKDEGNDGE